MRLRPASVARLALELALATFTLWLVVQNAALLLYGAPGSPRAFVLLGALLKALVTVLGAVWPWSLVALALVGAPVAALLARLFEDREERRAHHA